MGKSAQKKRNLKEIGAATAQFDKSRKKLEGFEFSDQYAGLEAQQAQAGQLGQAQGYGAAQAQGGQLGDAAQASAQGYQAEGYDAAQVNAAQASRVNIGEGTGRSNQFNNLQVSTAAADRQGEATDQALASQQESGNVTGAGGATALAQAAAASKAGISDSIAGQETANQQARAQGATSVQQEDLAQRNTSRLSDVSQGQFNTGLQQQANLANQSATNQASAFGASANNQAAQFGASAQNQLSQFNASSQNQFAQSQFGSDNQFALANQQSQNQASQFGASSQNQFSQAQFGADNQFASQNAQATNQFALSKAQGAAQHQDTQYNQIANLYSQDAARRSGAIGAEQQRKQASTAAWTGLAGSALGAAGSFASDPRLKENIELVGISPSGISIYEWDYIDKEGRFQGAMSTEVPEEAVIKNFIGEFDGVDYSKIDVEFKSI